MESEARLQWEDPAWLAAAHDWILAALGDRITGPIEQPHVRPWSTVLRIPTHDGPVWFKANMPPLAHEAAVVSLLSRRRPDTVPELIAADLECGWMLQRDAGTRLREAGLDVSVWEEVLPLCAELQIEASSDRDALLTAGVPDRGLTALPALYEALLDDPDLTADEIARLHALAPRITEECAALAARGIPETIQHDDLHDGQVFVRDGRFRILDWGDSCVAHPFLILTVTLRRLGYLLGLPEDAAGLRRFRDAYLEPWTRLASRAELLAAVPGALLLGGLSRLLTWREIIAGMPPSFAAQWDEYPAELRRLLLMTAP